MGTSARWAVGLIATSISGIGAGGLWTAQTAFFSSSAKHYAALTGCEIVRANGIFAAIFVSFYLGFEILLKILTSLVQLKEHAVAVFTIFTIIAASSALGCVLFVRPVASVSNAPLTKGTRSRLHGKMLVGQPTLFSAKFDFFYIVNIFLLFYLFTRSFFRRN